MRNWNLLAYGLISTFAGDASGRTENNAPVRHTRTALLYPPEAPVTNTLTDQEAIQGKWEKSMLEDKREAPYHALENSMNGGQDGS